MAKYDENLDDNSFVKFLRQNYCSILRRAVQDNWIVCVPRAATVIKSALNQLEVMKHILVPDLTSDTSYTTLTDQRVFLYKDAVIIRDTTNRDSSLKTKVTILFSEVVYDKFGKYKLLCLEHPLFCDGTANTLLSVSSFEDAIILLCQGKSSFQVLKKLDGIINNICDQCETICSLEILKQKCFQCFNIGCTFVKSHPLFKKKAAQDSYYSKLISLAVETYLHHKIFPTLIEALNVISAEKDAQLNLHLCNAANIQKSDLNVDCNDKIIDLAKNELHNLAGFQTIIDKLECLKRTISILNLHNEQLSSDEILPYFVLLTIRVALPNWHAQLLFLKNFHMLQDTQSCSEEDFNITTLEAALKYVESGKVFYSTQAVNDASKEDSGCFILKSEVYLMGISNTNNMVAKYFEMIKRGNYLEVIQSLESVSSSGANDIEDQLCHPLCKCDTCVSKLNQYIEDTAVATVSSTDNYGRIGLHIACALGWPKIVKILLNKKVDVDARDNGKNTAVHYAAQKGHKNCLLLLLHAEASVNCKNKQDNTPLHMAAMNGHSGCLKGLLFYSELNDSIDCHTQNINGDTPVHLACKYGYKESVIYLLDRLLDLRCNLLLCNKKQCTTADCCHNTNLKSLVINAELEIGPIAAIKEKPKPLQPTSPGAVSRNSSIDSGCQSLNSPFLYSQDASPITHKIDPCKDVHPGNEVKLNKSSVESGKLEKALRAFRVNDAKLACYYLGFSEDCQEVVCTENLQDSKLSLCHPLCQCSKCLSSSEESGKPISILDMNLLNSLGKDGLGVLHVASSRGQTQAVSLLLKYGCDVNLVSTAYDSTALHFASEAGHTGTVLKLLQQNANPNLKNSNGNTALHFAAASGSVQMMEFLISNGAQLKVLNNDGCFPQDIALQFGYSAYEKEQLVQCLFFN